MTQMIRKIIIVGGSLGITIPRKEADRLGLKFGDFITVNINDSLKRHQTPLPSGENSQESNLTLSTSKPPR